MRPFFKMPGYLSVLFSFYLSWSVCFACGETAFIPDINPVNVKWSQLSYQAKSIFGKVKTDVQAQIVPVEDVAQLLLKDPSGEALQPSGETVIAITIKSNIEPLFGADEILKTRSWFDPRRAAALQRIRLRLGKDKWQKSYRFAKKGVYRLRRKPQNASEEMLPLDRWTRVRNHFYAYPDKADACPQILEPASLLHIASAVDLRSETKPVSLCVFNKKHLHLVNVNVGGLQPMTVNYVQKRGKKAIRIENKIDAIKISMAPQSLIPEDPAPEEFSFLGLKGKFDILIDPTSSIPVQVSGKIGAFGKVDIILQEATLVLSDQ